MPHDRRFSPATGSVMRVLDHAAVAAALPWPDLVDALDRLFREGGVEAPLRHAHALPGDGTLLLMPAWRPGGGGGGVSGVKVVQVSPGNGALGLPAVHATYLLSDAATGRPLAALDGGELTDRRTAAASVLAARHLARPDSARLLLLGSGRVARALAAAYASAFPLTDVAVWSRDPGHAERLARDLAASGLPARAVASPDPSRADVVSAATLSEVALVRGTEVAPGTHVDLVGAFRPAMREGDGALMARATVCVDTRAGALAEAGDIVRAIAEGHLTPEGIAADLAELCRGEHPGRTRADEVTVFKSVGWAGEDLAAAALAYERIAAGAG